jgi:cell division protein FtsB
MNRTARRTVGHLAYVGAMALIALYFIYAAIQGDHGLFRRAEVEAETLEMRVHLAELSSEVAQMENLTRRMSDDYLDLDLADQQIRDVLGMIRSDEVLLRQSGAARARP